MEHNLTTLEINKLIDGPVSNPHSILGMHPVESTGGVCVRAFCPEAVSMRLVTASGVMEMKMLDQRGFFVWVSTKPQGLFSYQLKITLKDGSSWQTADPYSFLPQFGEMDLHLFNSGKHLELHRKMGGRIWKVGETTGTLFTVWAPNALAVSVTGSFNNWNSTRHPMRTLGASGIWELFIPGVSCGDYYRYLITAKNGTKLEKSDPYAVCFEKRPGNSSVVEDPFSYTWSDENWMTRRRNSSTFDAPVSIYELHASSWTRKGNDFNSWGDLAQWLIPYVKDLGFTHIELLPVMEHPLDESWGYQVTGFLAPTSRMGTPWEFCQFVDSCHRADLGVIVDWPPAHFPADQWALAKFDGTCLYEHEDPKKGYHPDWNTLIFNYGRNEVRNFLYASAFQWLDTFHADGIRVDAVASMLYLDYSRKDGQWIPNRYGGRENLEAVEFLKELNHYAGTLFPGTMMIAEESTDWSGVTIPPDKGGLGFHFKWNMGWMNDTLEFFRADPVYRKHMLNKITFSAVYAWSENYILPLSHDEVVHGKGSLLNKMPGSPEEKQANLRLLVCLQWFFPGKQLLFMGGERAQDTEWNHSISLPEGGTEMREFVSSLNRFYLDHPQLFRSDCTPEGFQWVDFSDTDSTVVSFLRKTQGMKPLLCIFNMTPVQRYNYRIGVPEEGTWSLVFNSTLPFTETKTSESVPRHGFSSSIEVTLHPLCCSVYTVC
ncbi:1,4-alpha-glucan branching enzyme [Candidatus Fermentibacteria bacterium]|nr:MAG: 1,4-alpha-glucan branching enzyme [Candidatus Fermentibacteria bacterium]